MTNNSLGLIYGIIAMLGFGLSNAFAKQPLSKIKPLNLVFYRGLFSSTILFIVLLFTLNQATFSTRYLLLSVLLSILGFLPLFTFYKAIEVGKIGVVAPVAYTSTFVTILLAVLIYHERISPTGLLAFIVTIGGVFLLTVNFRDFKNSDLTKVSSGVPYAIFTSLGWGLFFFLTKIFIRELGPVLASLIVEIQNVVLAYLFLHYSRTQITYDSPVTLRNIGIIGSLGAIAIFSYYRGVQLTNVSTVAAISAGNPLVVALIGRFTYKEKLTLRQYLAAAAVIIGLILIAKS